MLTDSGIADTDLYLLLSTQAPLTSGFDPELVRLAFLVAAAASCDDPDRCDRILAETSPLLDPELDGISRLTRADLGRAGSRDELVGFASLLATILHTAPFQVPPGQPVPDAARRFLSRTLYTCRLGAWRPGVFTSEAGMLLVRRVDGYRYSLCAQLGERLRNPAPMQPNPRFLVTRNVPRPKRRRRDEDGSAEAGGPA